MRIKGIFFDMDGTIIHSLSLWDSIISGVVGSDNVDKFKAARSRYPGSGISQYKSILEEELGLECSEDRILQMFKDSCNWVFNESNILFLDGFKEFSININKSRKANGGIKKALVTNAPSYALDILRDKLDLKHYFYMNIFNSDMVGLFKPSPAIIIYALRNLGLEAQATVMFEDSDEGVDACNAARVRCIGIRGSITDESKCAMMIDNYVGLTVDKLKELS